MWLAEEVPPSPAAASQKCPTGWTTPGVVRVWSLARHQQSLSGLQPALTHYFSLAPILVALGETSFFLLTPRFTKDICVDHLSNAQQPSFYCRVPCNGWWQKTVGLNLQRPGRCSSEVTDNKSSATTSERWKVGRGSIQCDRVMERRCGLCLASCSPRGGGGGGEGGSDARQRNKLERKKEHDSC